MAKILLAEDEVNIASFIERGLKEFGHSVTVCHNGNTGWKVLQEEPFDLVILDIIMPKINGLELCHLPPEVRLSDTGHYADSFGNDGRYCKGTGCRSR